MNESSGAEAFKELGLPKADGWFIVLPNRIRRRNNMQQPVPVTPAPIFDVITGYQRSALLKTAIELEVFTKVGQGLRTAAALASAADASERGIRILCDSLAVMGLLEKSEAAYSLNDVSAAFLDNSSPAYIGGAVDFLMSDAQVEGFENLTDSVRRGGADPVGNAAVSADSEMWVKFARGMMAFMYPTAEITAANIDMPADRELRILDIAAGHGLFGILAANRYPNAQVYGADWPSVLTVAKENAERFGVTDRYHLIEGDAFQTNFGTGYDVILIPNFLHHFDKETCTSFLKKCRESLKEEGRAVTVEFIPNDDRVSPPMEAMFPLIMLASTPAGDAYTFAELQQMFEEAGFSRNKHVSLEPMPSHLVISQK